MTPEIAHLYNFEPVLEGAWKTILLGEGITAATQREVENLPVPRVDVQCSMGGAIGHRRVWNGSAYLDAYACKLTLQVVTSRKAVNSASGDGVQAAPAAGMADAHNALRAKIRVLAQYAEGKFGPDVLPLHALTKIQESGTIPTVASQDDCDMSQISFDCMVSIRSSAWPK